MEGWINDNTYQCEFCENVFAVFYKEESNTNFCPNCGSRNLVSYEEDDIE